jgi:hypothetical protein
MPSGRRVQVGVGVRLHLYAGLGLDSRLAGLIVKPSSVIYSRWADASAPILCPSLCVCVSLFLRLYASTAEQGGFKHESAGHSDWRHFEQPRVLLRARFC